MYMQCLKRALEPLKLKLKTVSHMWVLRIKLRCSGRAVLLIKYYITDLTKCDCFKLRSAETILLCSYIVLHNFFLFMYSFLNYYFMCLGILPRWVFVHHVNIVNIFPQRQEEGVGSSGTGVTGGLSCHVGALN